MLETFIVIAVIALLVGLGLAVVVLSLATLLIVGVVCIAAGFALGVPAGIYYHVKLYRLLSLRGDVPREFWLRPTRYHALLEPSEWRGVMPWFVAGGVGFVLIVLGCLVVMLGVLKS